ncbi:hypothetical protein DFH06DRAFT_1186079 [Mycena polygramma]|nr:hypothetical protein DFH06DRAFT_1186079 [Mycena polygramma]
MKEEYPTSSHTPLHGLSGELADPSPFYQTWRGKIFKKVFLNSIRHFARAAKANDQLVILLFGHGDDDNASSGRVECGASHSGKAVWLLPKEVENAIHSTRARVTVVSTACVATSWVSSSWDLFASATAQHCLPASGPERMWNSTFWSAILNPELATNSHSCTFHPRTIHPQSNSVEPRLIPNEADASDEESYSDSDSDKSDRPEDFEEEGSAVDPQHLRQMLKHWVTTTRPLNLYIADRGSVFRTVQGYLAGTATRLEELKIAVQFKQRSDADTLAQSVADSLGIALDVRCADFREVDEMTIRHGIPFIVVDWGSVYPRDVVARMCLRYKKAGQWLFSCWGTNGKGRADLETILKMVGGKIYDEWIERMTPGQYSVGYFPQQRTHVARASHRGNRMRPATATYLGHSNTIAASNRLHTDDLHSVRATTP